MKDMPEGSRVTGPSVMALIFQLRGPDNSADISCRQTRFEIEYALLPAQQVTDQTSIMSSLRA